MVWLLSLTLFPLAMLAVIRWLRWLAFAQQKEYRLDRLVSWLKTDEAGQELRRWWPQPSDFSRRGLKRPRITFRVLTVAVLSGMIVSLGLGTSYWLGGIWALWFVAIVVYLVLPGVIVLALVPTAVVSELVILSQLRLAARLVKQHQPLIIGIGGCYGKTTTKHLLHQVIKAWKPCFVTPYSYNTRYSVARSILQNYHGEPIMLIEYGTYKRGEIAELASYFPPQLAVETGFTEQHLSLFGSIENILAAEGELAAALPPEGLVFCHAADAGAVRIAEVGVAESGAKIVPYTGDNAQLKLSDVRLDDQGYLQFKWHGEVVKTRLVGRHYEVNVRAALTVAEHLAIPAEVVVTALRDFKPNNRFITSEATKHGLVIDDGFAVNPAGFQAAIELLKELQARRQPAVTVVAFSGIVDLGPMSGHIHTNMAQQLKNLGCEVWYLGAAGQSDFEAVFGETLRTSRSAVMARVQELQTGSQSVLMLLEGRMPAWLLESLKHV